LQAAKKKLFSKGVLMSIKDSNGTELNSGDSVTVIKDLKVKGAAMTIKRGTLFKDIRLTDHNEEVECGKGRNTIVLKTCFLKKA
jgi:protein PhnA